MTPEALTEFEMRVHNLGREVEKDPVKVLEELPEMVHEFFGSGSVELTSRHAAYILLASAGVLIDSAVRVREVAHLLLADAWLGDVLDSYQLEDTVDLIAQVFYFRGNARIGVADISSEDELKELSSTSGGSVSLEVRRAASVSARWASREPLRDGRYDLTWSAGFAAVGDPDAEGRSLCNLANTLDNSGRWIEAYDNYVKALKADPTNGNAAGNAAVLIEWAINRGWDFEGHLCSLFDHYLSMAKDNRARTVEVAGESAAQRFDAMELLGSHEPLRVEPAEDDTYQAWVAEHRLALVAGLEGVGAGDVEGRWDTINLRQVTSPLSDPEVPSILDILNVLKGDFLAARRLGFEASEALAQTDGWVQSDDDPGVYTETLKYAVVGEVSAKLVLAHRAALDVLDKTAVALNEHLGIGDPPDKINFRTFWFEHEKRPENRYNALRAVLLEQQPIALQVLAMAELAYDMTEGGIHSDAQKVRNAGTHRFVMLHQGIRDVDSTPTMRAIPVREMVTTVLESLSVARAAFIYMVDMISAVEARKFAAAERDGALVPLPIVDTV